MVAKADISIRNFPSKRFLSVKGLFMHCRGLCYTTNYNAMGNITFKSDAGTLQYEFYMRPYRLTGQVSFPSNVDTDLRTGTYTSGERPATISKSGKTATFTYNHAGKRTKMAVTGTGAYTRIYLGGNYEHEVSGNTTTERLYLGGTAYSAPAVAIRTNNGAWALHYINRDHLGSIVTVTNASGAVVESNSYDAWGRLRNTASLLPFTHDAQPTLLLRRGYTGHEHLPEFGLVNMNARMYDPVIGRFLSPDPYVQAPYFSQSYNRYSYCLNNPLIFTDPTGEKWWKWVLGAMFFLDPISATTTVTVAGGSVAATAVGAGISTYATTIANTPILFLGGAIDKNWKRGRQLVSQSWKINNGLYYTDPNKNFWEQAWQLTSRFSWESFQTTVGYYYTQGRNALGYVDRVDFFGGATWATSENASARGGRSISNYINMKTREEITGSFEERVLSDPWFMHEYGHYIQSQNWGPLYLPVVGIASGIAASKNDIFVRNDQPYNRTMDDIAGIEMKANRRAEKYFRNNYGVDWDYEGNDIFYKFPLHYTPHRSPIRRRSPYSW